MSNNYKDLIVWQKSMLLIKEIYIIAKLLPADERKNLGSQIKRASVSIASNIAEGYSRGSKNYYRQFLKTAFGSASELECQLEIIKMNNLIPAEKMIKANGLLLEILKMLSTMIGNATRDRKLER